LIDQTFLHLPGVGPVAESKIRAAGLRSWSDLLSDPQRLPFRPKQADAFFRTLAASQKALEEEDIAFLVNHVTKKEQWRILNAFRQRASFFDIETDGLDLDAQVTVIACLHRGELHHFVRGENLDDFLDLIEVAELLVSFNGASFDIPQLCRTWCIPDLGVAHIDLRWQCYHHQLRGGLKEIERRVGIDRPLDLHGVDGEEAVWLWDDWQRRGDREAYQRLVRYCCADVVTLSLLTDALLRLRGLEIEAADANGLWTLLDGLNSRLLAS